MNTFDSNGFKTFLQRLQGSMKSELERAPSTGNTAELERLSSMADRAEAVSTRQQGTQGAKAHKEPNQDGTYTPLPQGEWNVQKPAQEATKPPTPQQSPFPNPFLRPQKGAPVTERVTLPPNSITTPPAEAPLADVAKTLNAGAVEESLGRQYSDLLRSQAMPMPWRIKSAGQLDKTTYTDIPGLLKLGSLEAADEGPGGPMPQALVQQKRELERKLKNQQYLDEKNSIGQAGLTSIAPALQLPGGEPTAASRLAAVGPPAAFGPQATQNDPSVLPDASIMSRVEESLAAATAGPEVQDYDREFTRRVQEELGKPPELWGADNWWKTLVNILMFGPGRARQIHEAQATTYTQGKRAIGSQVFGAKYAQQRIGATSESKAVATKNREDLAAFKAALSFGVVKSKEQRAQLTAEVSAIQSELNRNANNLQSGMRSQADHDRIELSLQAALNKLFESLRGLPGAEAHMGDVLPGGKQ